MPPESKLSLHCHPSTELYQFSDRIAEKTRLFEPKKQTYL